MKSSATRDSILEMLRKKQSCVSGEYIAGELAISRAGVWKHIRALKDSGYVIESHKKQGYKLVSPPFSQRFATGLETAYIGRELSYFETVESTNTIAKDMASSGCGDGTVVIAKEQIGGKGRLGRQWVSPIDCGLYMSIVIRPEIATSSAQKISVPLIMSIVFALEDIGVQAKIKWPNDVVCAGKKLCGILMEMRADMDSVEYIILGIGLNIRTPADAVCDPLLKDAIALDKLKDEKTDEAVIAAGICNRFESTMEALKCRDFDIGFLLDGYRKRCITLDKDVFLESNGQKHGAYAMDIDENGALIIKKDDGTMQKVLAGDVSVRGSKTYV